MLKKLLLLPFYILKWIFFIGVMVLLVSLFTFSVTFVLGWIVSLIGVGILDFLLKLAGGGIVAFVILACAISDWRNKNV